MIDVDRVSKRYGTVTVLRDVSMKIERGELVALLGESGSGKTTLMKMFNRLNEPDTGVVRVDGVDVKTEDPVLLRRRIGYVIQHVGLLPHLTIADNIATVPRLLRWEADRIAARVDELLDLVGLPAEKYRERYPDQLSGGQRQRVGVARALAARPLLLLLDEPFGALDPVTRAGLQRELRTIHKDLGLTTLIVTHDMVEALTLADRIAVMRNGELLQLAPPAQLMSAPADDYVAALVAMAWQQGEQLLALRKTS